LGSPHGEVGLAIWQNSKLSNSNVEWVTWECGSGLHNLQSPTLQFGKLDEDDK
jgi:hypothetical protein